MSTANEIMATARNAREADSAAISVCIDTYYSFPDSARWYEFADGSVLVINDSKANAFDSIDDAKIYS